MRFWDYVLAVSMALIVVIVGLGVQSAMPAERPDAVMADGLRCGLIGDGR
jgi:hypothetical protein